MIVYGQEELFCASMQGVRRSGKKSALMFAYQHIALCQQAPKPNVRASPTTPKCSNMWGSCTIPTPWVHTMSPAWVASTDMTTLTIGHGNNNIIRLSGLSRHQNPMCEQAPRPQSTPRCGVLAPCRSHGSIQCLLRG